MTSHRDIAISNSLTNPYLIGYVARLYEGGEGKEKWEWKVWNAFSNKVSTLNTKVYTFLEIIIFCDHLRHAETKITQF